jgi:hypothetical protein
MIHDDIDFQIRDVNSVHRTSSSKTREGVPDGAISDREAADDEQPANKGNACVDARRSPATQRE